MNIIYKKLLKNQIVPFNGFLLDEKEFKKIQREKKILDKIDKIVRNQNNSVMSNNDRKS